MINKFQINSLTTAKIFLRIFGFFIIPLIGYVRPSIKKLNNEDFDIDEKGRNILLTNRGIDSVEKIFSEVGILKNNNFYDPENLSLVHLVNQSLILIKKRLNP